jgi:hypothetical protein
MSGSLQEIILSTLIRAQGFFVRTITLEATISKTINELLTTLRDMSDLRRDDDRILRQIGAGLRRIDERNGLRNQFPS